MNTNGHAAQLVSLNSGASFQKPLTLREAAAVLRCSKAHVCNLVNGKVRGVPKLPSVALGRRRLILPNSLQKWLAEAEANGL